MPHQQLDKGFTFTDGGTGYTAANLHALIKGGTILPGAILEQLSAPPTTDSTFLYEHNGLRRCSLQQIIANVPANGAANVASLRRLGTAATMAAPGNDSRFPARFQGIRKANGPAADTIAVPKDTLFTPVNLQGAGHTQVDWDAADVFYDHLGANKTYTFANIRSGRTVQLIVQLNGHVATLPVAIGTVVVGNGTTLLHGIFTSSGLGITGLQIFI